MSRCYHPGFGIFEPVINHEFVGSQVDSFNTTCPECIGISNSQLVCYLYLRQQVHCAECLIRYAQPEYIIKRKVCIEVYFYYFLV